MNRSKIKLMKLKGRFLPINKEKLELENMKKEKKLVAGN
jgi:hypothetical protein